MENNIDKTNLSSGSRTENEKIEPLKVGEIFDRVNQPSHEKLDNFPKYIRKQSLTRLLALYEIFKLTLKVKGSIIECGVNNGFGLFSWAKFSSILEPNNLTRRIYGFDSFSGFPSISAKDKSPNSDHIKKGDLSSNSYEELLQLISIYDSTRFIGHVEKVKLIKGDAIKTIPEFVEQNPHTLVSLLFLDFDLYEPTKVALDTFLPRMPGGSIIAFDELDNPLWPGETLAMLDFLQKYGFKLSRFEFDPYISYAILK